MSTNSLIEYLESIDVPDQIYWDARELKKLGQKFQNLDWANFPRAIKINGVWAFAPTPAPVTIATPVAAPAAIVAAPRVAVPPPAAKIANESAVVSALREADDQVGQWVASGMQHPAPASIGEIKARLGCGWTQIQRAAQAMFAEIGGAK